MTDQWFYSDGETRKGPFSASQLQELAANGTILRTNTVWKEGIERGVPASKVKGLFSLAQASVQPVPALSALATAPLASETAVPGAASEDPAAASSPMAQSAEVSPPPTPDSAAPALGEVQAVQSPSSGHAPQEPKESAPEQPKPTPPAQTARKGRAVGARGAIIVSQDGFRVSFRKKCVQCGHEDASKSGMPIRNGTTRVSFFCPKCRKLRPVEIQCTT
jgi:hypothetical protein